MGTELRGWVISAFAELQALGHLGPECVELIEKLTREEAARFPVLTPAGGWQPADLQDMVSTFLSERIDRVTANLLALASNDASLGRLLRKSIRHWLIDRARRTGVGFVRRVVEKVLADEHDVEQVPEGEEGAGRWRSAGTSVGPWVGAVDELVAAARAVPNVKIPKWSSTVRRPPIADRASIAAVINAVFAAAEGSLEVAQLVQVFVARFPVVLDPTIVPLPQEIEYGIHDAITLTPEELVIAAEEELDAATSAASVVGMLSPKERQIVRYLDDVPAIQTLLNCGRSTAFHHAKRVREKLKQLVGDKDVREVGLEVIWLCGGAAGEE